MRRRSMGNAGCGWGGRVAGQQVGFATLLGVAAIAVFASPGRGEYCNSSGMTIERISVGGIGQQFLQRSELPAVNADGCVVAFKSFSGISGDDRNGTVDVYVRDRRDLSIEQVSVAAVPGRPTNGPSSPPVLDASGNLVAFASDASNLIPSVPGDFNSSRDVFSYDRSSAVTRDLTLVLDAFGQGRGGGLALDAPPSLTADGTLVAFASSASDLVPNRPEDPYSDIFVCNPTDCSHTMELISIASSPLSAVEGNSGGPALSDTGIVAFYSDAPNLIPIDTNQVRDVFVRDRNAGTTERVSVSETGQQTDAASAADTTVAISSDGCVVAFSSLATNLVGGTPPGIAQIYLRDRCINETVLVSKNRNGDPGNGASQTPSLSADGRFVAFSSAADNLLQPDADDTNHVSDIFVVDRTSGAVARVSLTQAGDPAAAISIAPRISGDGTTVVFQSDAALVPEDTNGVSDIYAAFNILSVPATPEPTDTPTPTPTPSQTSLATGTMTPTLVGTASATASAQATTTPTPTLTVIPSGTATHAPTLTPTQPPLSATQTPTQGNATPSASPTRTSTTISNSGTGGGGGGGCSCRIDPGVAAPPDVGLLALGLPLLVWTWRRRVHRAR